MKAVLDAALDPLTPSPLSYAIRILATDFLTTSTLSLDMGAHLLSAPILFTDTDGVTTAELEFTPVWSSEVAFNSCWQAALASP
jgi:hypothetical protein